MRRFAILVLSWLPVFTAGALPQTGREEHPCVYLTRADVAQARKNIKRWKWAGAEAQTIIKNADEWLQRPDDWFAQQLPAKGACFAYGFTGCPICSAGWGLWGAARCSWDKPGKVTCLNGHVLPDAEHPDAGTGYKDQDRRIHYFVGSYNAWVVETLEAKACSNLVLAFSLTGDDRYAHKAAIILDELATIYPGCTSGSWDYPSVPPSGRFARPWYQVARVLVHYVDYYDQIYQTKTLEEPSRTPGLTRRQNIEENLLRNGGRYCFKESLHGSLNNGEADYVRGALAVGCVLGLPEYVDWALDGPFGIRSYLANNVDRDGRYFETSMLYSVHTRSLYESFSEPLLHWREPVDLYKDPKFKAFLTLPELAANCLGHKVSYGDSAPDLTVKYDVPQKNSAADYDYAELLYARATTAAEKKAYGALVSYLAGGNIEAARAGSPDKDWLLFHAGEPPAGSPPLTPELDRRLNRTYFLGREGIGLLRAGGGTNAQALLLRYGESLNHGHLDDLNVNYYALGREVTYDLGYSLGSTHTQVGWADTTASHNLVVVNEKPQHGGPRAASGGSLLLIGDTPLAQVVEAESANSYGNEGGTEYRRLCAIIGEGKERYLLDVFWVAGGQQHDYLFHCGTTNVSFDGVTLGQVEKGSLAGPDVEWGNLQLNDGDMAGHPNKPYWHPPPDNGYGFLVSPQRARTDDSWTATWQWDDLSAVRLHLLGAPGTEVITATAPGIYPSLPKARYVLARRTGTNLHSTFVAVMEPFSKSEPFIASVEAIKDGVRVRQRNGRMDEIEFREGFVLRRTQEAKKLGGCRIEPAAYRGKILAVDYKLNMVTTDLALPAGQSLVGQTIFFANPATTRNTPYRIEGVEKTDGHTLISLGEKNLFLGRGRVGKKLPDNRTLISQIPQEYANAKQQKSPNGFFSGKLIRTTDGKKTAQVRDMTGGRAWDVTVDNSEQFKIGDDFFFCDVQAGDDFVVSLVKSD